MYYYVEQFRGTMLYEQCPSHIWCWGNKFALAFLLFGLWTFRRSQHKLYYTFDEGLCMDEIICVNNASVRFNIASERIDSIKEYFIKLMKRQLMFQEFFALKNINLHVKKGESWGIIGVNGSGKSTLLKLVCGILKPYTGTVELRGSVAPLIELGAGFDMDLTARENIFLNGAVLGHSRKFMKEKFDEIVEFAELRVFGHAY